MDAVLQRAVEIAVSRVVALVRDQERRAVEQGAVNQDKMRQAYRDVIYAPDFEAAYQGFEQEYGEEAFYKQARLAAERIRAGKEA